MYSDGLCRVLTLTRGANLTFVINCLSSLRSPLHIASELFCNQKYTRRVASWLIQPLTLVQLWESPYKFSQFESSREIINVYSSNLCSIQLIDQWMSKRVKNIDWRQTHRNNKIKKRGKTYNWTANKAAKHQLSILDKWFFLLLCFDCAMRTSNPTSYTH